MCRVLAIVDKCVYSNYITATITTNGDKKMQNRVKGTMSKIREMAANGDEAAKAELEFRLNRVSEVVFEEPKIDGYDSMFGFERDDYKAAIRNGQQPCSK